MLPIYVTSSSHLPRPCPPPLLQEVSPPARGTGISHQRKLHSYQVEAHFYQHVAPRLLASHPACALPNPLFVRSNLHTSSGGSMVLVLEDLSPAFPSSSSFLNLAHTRAALDWLATFHAALWGQQEQGLWEDGCYWHLATRCPCVCMCICMHMHMCRVGIKFALH